MINLAQVYSLFQHYLQTGQADALHDLVGNSEHVSRAQRLTIYRDAYQSRLQSCLISNYPIFERYIGHEMFQKIAKNYIDQHPSSYRSIRWYGDNFSSFLGQHYQNLYPYLTELAEFEWRLGLAFDAADANVLAIDDLEGIKPECWGGMRFLPHPSLQQCYFSWNVVAIWQALMNNKQPDPPLESAKLNPWVIWRHHYRSRFYCLEEKESWALTHLINGVDFGEICAGLCQWFSEDEVGLRAASFLKSWIQSGLLSEFILTKKETC
jgi:hypothetical protein